MRRLGLALLLALLTAGSAFYLHGSPSPAAPEHPRSCKPTAPIDLTAEIVGDPAAPFGIQARASSRSGREVELEIVLPDGVTHVAGERKIRGKRCEARVDLRAADRQRREIFVRASITEGGAILTRVIPLVLFEAAKPPPGTKRRNSRGEAILELTP
ncbi:MAG TPA: hypothetical protein VNM14_01485 [Planctomycetota bacterium]|jgi:hypothetical protein|nr:hypothetical protein [Planctomycetota bacterium]